LVYDRRRELLVGKLLENLAGRPVHVGMKQEPVCKILIDLRHPFEHGLFEFGWFVQLQFECNGGHPFTPFLLSPDRFA
jgi:hypothetical protein